MLPKVANTLIHHTHRAVVAVQNQTGHALRNALQSSSGSSTAVAGWGSPVSGGSSHSGPGPSKFHASGRLQTSHNGTPITSSNVRDRVEKLKAFRVPSAQHRSHLPGDASSDASQLVRSGFGTYATLINTLTDRDFENHETVRRAEARLRRRRRAGLDENAQEENRIASLKGDAHFKSALALFQTAAANPNSKFPLQIYNKLLRSCALHANPEAAAFVFGHLEKRADVVPDAQTYISLIETYASRRDVQGAERMFANFKEASRSDRVQWTCDGVAAAEQSSQDLDQRASQTAVWNEMLATYFCCGQAADALGLLEQMMDTSAGETFRSADTPLPTSSTFSRAIAGFCQAGDISTALSWFERMLQQDTVSGSPNESTRVPHRPDPSTWTTMFDALADEGMVAELNRLFARWINISAQEGAAVWSDHRDSVLAANLKFMDSRADLDQPKAHELLDFLADHVLAWEIEGAHFTFYRDTSRTLCQRLIMQYWNRGFTDQALDLASRIAARQLKVIQHGQTERLFDATQAQRRIEGTRRFAADLTTDIMGKTGAGAPLSSLLRLSALLTDVGALVPTTLSESCLNAYALQRASPTLSLTTREWEALLEVVVASETDSSATLNTLVDDLLQHSADVAAFSDVAKNHLVRSLSWHDANSARLLAQFGEPFSSRYAELQRAQEEASSPAVSAHSFDAQTPLEEVPGSPLHTVSSGRIDTAHSQSVGEFYPGGNKAAVLTAFRRFKSGADRGIYPRPIVLARLVSALGRLGEVDKIYDVYDAAQVVLNSLETAKHWQTQGWFLIEDHMIIGLAHAGDLEAAHAHRQRILQQGGVPSADAYGALILHVKDTTDDTSNAMALFQESQSLGVTPNIFMYNTVISKLAKARKADYALQLFQDMKALGVQPTSVTYGAVIAACCRVGDAASAELLFQEMTAEPTFKPRVPPYNTMMQLYTHTKPDRARVLHYYNELLAARVQPTAHTYKLLIDAYGSIEPVDLPAMEKVFADLVADPSVSVQGTHWAALINAYGCVHKDLDKALQTFDSIATHPSTNPRNGPMPDAVVYEALINTLVTLRRMDLMPTYIDRLHASGVHMTAYIANLLIKGYASVGEVERSREIFESLQDPQEGVAAPHNHIPHQNKQASAHPVPANAPVYREPSTWEAMVRAELGNGQRDRAVSLLQRLQARMFPPAVYQRISGIMLDDSVAPWSLSDTASSPSFST